MVSEAITHWWHKYQIIRDIKYRYKKELENTDDIHKLNQKYIGLFLEAIK